MILANAHHVAFNIVDKEVTTDIPYGDSQKAWIDLGNNYNSKNSTAIVQLSNQFINSKLSNMTDDPEEWIVEIKILQARLDQMGYQISEKHLLIHILYNVPEKYESVVEADKKFLMDTTNMLDVETLKTHLHNKWVKFGLRSRTYDDNVNSKTLIRERQFKGRCYICGKFGHKVADCKRNPNKNKNDGDDGGQSKGGRKPFGLYGSGFCGKCRFCHEVGHI